MRSPHAHARVRRVDLSAAKTVPGVVAAYSGKDLAQGGVNPLPCGWLLPDLKIPEYRGVATDKVHFVGHAVAVVIGETPYAARDGADQVVVDYDVLPAVTDGEKAVQPGAPQIHANAPGNVTFRWSIGDKDKTAAAIKGAHRVVKQRLINHRLIPNAIEPRASMAHYNAATGELTCWVTSQNPHVHRLLMAAFVLGLPEHKVRVIAPDVGGGFGSKIFLYPEEVAISWASKQLGRPVKWTAERRESFVTDAHGRDHITEAEMAVDRDGKILALRVHTNANLGAYLSTFAPLIPTFLYGPLLSGAYKIPQIYCEVIGALTNTTPVDAYRGAGRPEATYLLERLCDLTAKAIGMDAADFRRKNLVPAAEFPYQTPVAFLYDSGNYEPALDRALQMIDYRKVRADQEAARKQGRYLGIGFATYIEACGPAPSQVAGALGAQAGLWESAQVRVHPTGKISVFTGSHSHGQGHETTFAQLAADELQVPFEDVEIVHGDTAAIPFGMGTYGSRSAAVGDPRSTAPSRRSRTRGRRSPRISWRRARPTSSTRRGSSAFGGRPGGSRRSARSPSWPIWRTTCRRAWSRAWRRRPSGTRATSCSRSERTSPSSRSAPRRARCKLLRYVAVDDVGRVINPMIVDGMVHGGIAQGVAQALYEYAAYDANGQLQSGSMMDYALPKADDLISYETDRTETPSPVNPMGIKGAGETGTIASTAAVANAVMDALAPLGISHLDMPLTPARIWAAIQAKKH